MATRLTSRIRLRLLQMRLHRRLRRRARARLLLSSLLLTACGGAERQAEAPAVPAGHLFSNEAAGIALQLPPNWAGRYTAADSITTPMQGLEREIALRFVASDSSVVPQPLIVVRVFTNEAWSAVPLDTAAAHWGTAIARDAVHTVAVKAANGNPLTAGTADALGYDSLMIAVMQRPMRASLRPPTVR